MVARCKRVRKVDMLQVNCFAVVPRDYFFILRRFSNGRSQVLEPEKVIRCGRGFCEAYVWAFVSELAVK